MKRLIIQKISDYFTNETGVLNILMKKRNLAEHKYEKHLGPSWKY